MLPGAFIATTVQPHMVPLMAVTTAPAQQAQAYSALGSRYTANVYESQYDQVWNLVNSYFLYQERLGSWDLWRHRFDGRLNSQQEAETSIDTMLASLKDEYTYYRDVDETASRQREEESRDVVQARMLPGNVAYIHLTTFNSKNCVDEMRESLAKLTTARAYVLDLRDNGGGTITNAFEIFSFFVNNGEFVRMVGADEGTPVCEEMFVHKHLLVTKQNGKVVASYREPNYTGTKPLAVLVNNNTKSAAEMLAGALRDDKRGHLTGTKTFGKGVVQRVWQFDQGTSIKITAARYFLPTGTNIHGVGLRPDLVVSDSPREDEPLKSAVAWLRDGGPTDHKGRPHLALHKHPRLASK